MWTDSLEAKDAHQVQGSKEWHEYRAKHVGASEVPAIMGTCDFKNIYQLWLEKTGKVEKFQGNWATRRGQEMEPVARRLYEAKTGFTVRDCVLEYASYPVLSASLDGFVDSEQLVIEIKTPSKAKHQLALSGYVPETYRDQVQAQLLVSGVESADYVSFSPDEPDETQLAIIRVRADKQRQQEILEAVIKFWYHVQMDIAPIDVATQPELNPMLVERQKVVDAIKMLEGELEQHNENIKAMMKANRVECENYVVSFTERKGNVEYAKIPELKTVDLEKYRKKSTKVFTVKERNK